MAGVTLILIFSSASRVNHTRHILILLVYPCYGKIQVPCLVLIIYERTKMTHQHSICIPEKHTLFLHSPGMLQVTYFIARGDGTLSANAYNIAHIIIHNFIMIT